MATINPAFAYALMPPESAAQRRANRQVAMQQQMALLQMDQQALAQRQQAEKELSQTIGLVDRLGHLSPDRKRLQAAYAEPFRRKVENMIVNDYKGDIRRFREEQGDFMMGQFLDTLAGSPELERAEQNKANYGLILEARKKGQAVLGDVDQMLADYLAGKREDLPFLGTYEPPKDVYQNLEMMSSPVAPNGVLDPKTKTRMPVEITQSDVLAYAMSSGLTPEQAADWVKKGGYVPGRFFKLEDSPAELARVQIDAAQAEETRLNNAFNRSIRQSENQLNWMKYLNPNDGVARNKNGTPVSVNDALYGPAGGKATVFGGAVEGSILPAPTPEVQTRLTQLAGLTPATTMFQKKNVSGTKAIGPRQSVPVIDSQGQSVYNIKQGVAIDASTPGVVHSLNNVKVERVDASQVVKLPASRFDPKGNRFPSKDGYISAIVGYVRLPRPATGKGGTLPAGTLVPMYLPLMNDRTVQLENDKVIPLTPNKTTQELAEQSQTSVANPNFEYIKIK